MAATSALRYWVSRLKLAFDVAAIKKIKMMLKLFLFLVAVLMGAGCTTMKYTHGVPNLVEVAPGIWRGGQPTDEGWKYLRQELGVTNVVKLNLGKDTCAEAIGMNVTYVPISYWQSVFRPKREQIDQAVGSITSCSYVHCTHGQDRTGLVIGEYRVKRDGWSRTRAFQEMLDRDFHRSLVGLWWFWNTANVSPNSLGEPKFQSVTEASVNQNRTKPAHSELEEVSFQNR